MITNAKIEEFLTRNELAYKLRANGSFVIKECPFCTKPHNNKPTNLWTLNLKENNGAFLCFRCNTHGSWYDLVRQVLGDAINFTKTTKFETEENKEEEKRAVQERTRIALQDCEEKHIAFLETVAFMKGVESGQVHPTEDRGLIANCETISYLVGKQDGSQRHLSIETLKTYKIGIGEEMFRSEEGTMVRVPVINFPLHKPTSKKNLKPSEVSLMDTIEFDCVRSKLRGIGSENKHYQRFRPTGGHFGVFGLHTFTKDSKVLSGDQVVVITEGEYDAMAVYEATGLPAVSLPNGASNLPTQLVTFVEHAERVYLWMDNDEAGQINIPTFVAKLGAKRTFVVNSEVESRLG